MKSDDLSWLCHELGLPFLEETADGLAASPASVLARGDRHLSLREAAALFMGLVADDSALDVVVERARRGERAALVTAPNRAGQSFRLLAAPSGREGAFVRLAMAQLPASSSEALVDVAAAVSHEVANAVGAIRGWADLALHKTDPAIDMRDALTLIRTAARSAEQAARGMLTVARGEGAEEASTRINLSDFAGEFVQLLRVTAREGRVTLETSIEPGLHVRASRSQLFTIVFNLVKNAIEASGGGGVVVVGLRSQGERVELTVQDSGSGFDLSTKERLFDRYFTTKANGTGLGLALVREAVEASRAEIAVESEEAQGTRFTVSFPLLVEQTAAEDETGWAPARHEAPEQGSPLSDLRVLVVDDDQALREMIATALSLRGAHVTGVRSAEEALRVDGCFDIALIDMMLEGHRGDELLALLRQRGAVSAAMLVTGTVQKPRTIPGGEPDDWVRKPFEIAHLFDRIRRTMERHRMLHAATRSAAV